MPKKTAPPKDKSSVHAAPKPNGQSKPSHHPPAKVITTLADIIPDPHNANAGTERGKSMVLDSMSRLKAGRSILVDRDGETIAGAKTLDAAKALNMPIRVIQTDGSELVVVQRIDLDNTTDNAAVELGIVDNQATLVGIKWDADRLREVAARIQLDRYFSYTELAKLLAVNAPADRDPGPQTDKADLLQQKWQVKPGDVWTIPSLHGNGSHRIVCGKSENTGDVARALDGRKAAICWTDPPWNVDYGKQDHPSYKKRSIANDDLGDKFPEFCAAFAAQLKSVMLPGALIYLKMSAQEWPVIDTELRKAGFHWSSTIIWAKDSIVMSRKDYHTQFEPIWYGWLDGAPRLVTLDDDRKQSDLWVVNRAKKSELHPMETPVEIPIRSIMNSSRPGDVAVDLFSGSGTVTAACEVTQRLCAALDQEPKFVACTLERLELMGCKPVRAGDVAGSGGGA